MTDSVAMSDSTGSIDLDLGNYGAVTREDAGSFYILNASNEEPIIDEGITFGSIEYEIEDGPKYVYEAGAVFKKDDNNVEVVSDPQYHYDEETYTLNFPVLDVDSGEKELNSGDINLNTHHIDSESRTHYDQQVEIEITSEYWEGWESYFIKETGAPWAVSTEKNPSDDLGTVVVNLGQISYPSAFSQAIHSSGDVLWGQGQGRAGEVNGHVIANGTVESGNYNDGYSEDEDVGSLDNIDDEIDEIIDEANDTYKDYSTIEDEITSGDYYSNNDITISNDVDLEDGDTTLVVDGDIEIKDNNVDVKNNDGNNTLYIYTTGTLTLSGNIDVSSEGSERNPEYLQVYGNTSFGLDMSGTPYFEGTIYAPDSKKIETASGNSEIYGSIVGGTVEINGNPTITHDESLNDLEPRFQSRSPPDLIYLNIAQYGIDIKNS